LFQVRRIVVVTDHGRDGPNPTDQRMHELLGKLQIENSKMAKAPGINLFGT